MAERKKAPRVMVVDDDAALVDTLGDALSDRGYEAIGISSGKEAAQRIPGGDFDALVTDLRMPGKDGLDLLALSRKDAPERPVIVMTAYSAVDTAIESIRRGAYHYLTKPFKAEELVLFLDKAIEEANLRREAVTLRRALREQFALSSIIGANGALREVCDLVERVADATAPVLIVGETGTGKGLIARAVHASGARASHPFVMVNCASVPENLLESELFGHMKGAFTGATSTRRGLFEEASQGTLFLDEIGEMPMPVQAKLLHVIERGVVRALGSDKERPVDVRVVAATHRDLRARVREGAFREDLLFRLDVLRIDIPPLRQRREDLPRLIGHALAQAKARHPESPVQRFSHEVLQRFLAHTWPGNVRELENTIERAVLLGRSTEVSIAELPASVGERGEDRTVWGGAVVPLHEMDKRYARWALEQLGGRKMLTAEKLGVDRKTLQRLLGGGGSDE